MNKTAVAMAADSVVTITAGRGRAKTYDTANKLFELLRGVPVGVMVFSNAEINGVPWETVIKAYREARAGLELDSLNDYAADFFDFLRSAENFILTDESERVAFEQGAYLLLLEIFGLIKEGLEACLTKAGRLVRARLHRLVDSSIGKVEGFLDRLDDEVWGGLTADALSDRFRESAGDLVDELFREFELKPMQKRRLVAATLSHCLKRSPFTTASGVVFAGFGRRQPFPSLVSFEVRDRLCGRVRRIDQVEAAVDQFNPGFFHPFAQDAMASQWATGINARTRYAIVDFWSGWLEDKSRSALEQCARSAAPRLVDATVAAIIDEQHDMLSSTLAAFLQAMNEHQEREFLMPLTQSIALLPKEELALVAESMVNLESLRQRTMVHELETVGGEIDLALISRGDGLVWLRRKHYFSLDLNPTWAIRNSAVSRPVGATFVSAATTGDP